MGIAETGYAGTTALFMQSAIALDQQVATMMTLASMVMVFATLLALRGLGAYHIRSLLQPVRSTVLAPASAPWPVSSASS